MAKREEYIVGLDIGTTKICALVGIPTVEGVDVIGIGTYPSHGLRKGVVVNIEATVRSIRRAVEEAELMAGCEIHSAFVGIAGGHIKGMNSHGVVALKSREVTEDDVRRVIDAAKAVAIPMDREVIHILPQEFIVDGQDGIKDPRGMSGVRLEVKVHIVTGAVTSAQNLIKCVNKAGMTVDDIVLQQLAASEAVLTPEEKELGVALVDIGGGTTDLAIFHRGSIKHTAVISLAGDHVTGDIAVGLRTPIEEAEKLKKRYGCALASMAPVEEVEVPPVGEGQRPRKVSRQLLAEIIEPRMEEILGLVEEEIERSGFRRMIPSGVVITGGSALMEGIVELAGQIFDLPVRRGYPKRIGGLVDIVRNPQYATAIGLVLYGAKGGRRADFQPHEENIFDKVSRRMKEWFKEMFS
ncbi:MAG: cell division protein FtsA [Deltaproteobacteria bacterium]|nr:MAG: cell division protein FtsA [Deltaproteobacteria bacterium]RLB02075.1 MAG: cell division protein FtsA [Deltaproteobacteria bacterium]